MQAVAQGLSRAVVAMVFAEKTKGPLQCYISLHLLMQLGLL